MLVLHLPPGVLGPTLVNLLREHWIAQGYSKSHAYDATLYIMAGLLVVGFLCNQAIRPLAKARETVSSGSTLPAAALLESIDSPEGKLLDAIDQRNGATPPLTERGAE
jgi:hypothetical protein